MKKTTLLFLLFALLGSNAYCQVLGGTASSNSSTWGIGVMASTSVATGRTFYYSTSYGNATEIIPDEYSQSFLPGYGFELWHEGFTEPWFFGYMISLHRTTLRYTATFNAYNTILIDRVNYWDRHFAVYGGYRILDNLSVSAGLSAEYLSASIADPFTGCYSLGLLLLARYDLSDNFYASLRVTGGVPVLRSVFNYNEWMSAAGFSVSEANLQPITASVGLGILL